MNQLLMKASDVEKLFHLKLEALSNGKPGMLNAIIDRYIRRNIVEFDSNYNDTLVSVCSLIRYTGVDESDETVEALWNMDENDFLKRVMYEYNDDYIFLIREWKDISCSFDIDARPMFPYAPDDFIAGPYCEPYLINQMVNDTKFAALFTDSIYTVMDYISVVIPVFVGLIKRDESRDPEIVHMVPLQYFNISKGEMDYNRKYYAAVNEHVFILSLLAIAYYMQVHGGFFTKNVHEACKDLLDIAADRGMEYTPVMKLYKARVKKSSR